jgi:hypothetical protein
MEGNGGERIHREGPSSAAVGLAAERDWDRGQREEAIKTLFTEYLQVQQELSAKREALERGNEYALKHGGNRTILNASIEAGRAVTEEIRTLEAKAGDLQRAIEKAGGDLKLLLH